MWTIIPGEGELDWGGSGGINMSVFMVPFWLRKFGGC